jgi:hypothetical protein
MTGAELQAEDNRIWAGLHPRVKALVERRFEARRHANFGGKTLAERMSDICERDAAKFTPAEPVSAAKAEVFARAEAIFVRPVHSAPVAGAAADALFQPKVLEG